MRHAREHVHARVTSPGQRTVLHANIFRSTDRVSKGSLQTTRLERCMRWCLDLVLERGYASFSLENVATPALASLLAEYARQRGRGQE